MMVAGGYVAAVAVPVCDIIFKLVPLRDFVTFTYDVIF